MLALAENTIQRRRYWQARGIQHYFGKLQEYKAIDGPALDNTIVLFGSGASTTHNPRNLPTMLAGGANMGLKHGTYWRRDDTRMSNVFLSILHSMGIHQESFADSTGTISDSIFAVCYGLLSYSK
ncbi:MAG: hypothetical protein KDB27_23895 [Planctomycetales bacterium]|nr:hypothetical protein [Planctomycetales bacterium]